MILEAPVAASTILVFFVWRQDHKEALEDIFFSLDNIFSLGERKGK